MLKDLDHNFSLRHLAALLAVVDCKQISAASEQLHKSPSSIARSIDILEERLGHKLLQRSIGGVEATAEGELVAARGNIVKQEFSDLRDSLTKSRENITRENASMFSMHLDVSRLRALVAVHDFGSVQRARQLLGISQPGVSSSIRFLETDLGVQLFSRTPEGMIPTPAGITATLCAKRVLSELRKIRDDADSAGGVSSGQVRVGGLAYSRNTLLPKAINRILEDFPQIQIQTVEGPINTLLSALHAGEIDFLICARPHASLLEGVSVEPVVKDPMSLFVSHQHPLAEQNGIGPEDALAYPFILPPQGSVTRSLLEQAFLDCSGQMPKGTVETSSYTIIRHLLLNSPQIAFRSISEFGPEQQDKLLIPLKLGFALPARTICILQRHGVRPTAAMQDFLSIIHDVSRSGTEER